MKSIDNNLLSGMSPEQVYIETNKNQQNPSCVVNLQTVHNRNYALTKKDSTAVTNKTEVEALISCSKDDESIVQSVRFIKDRYTAILYNQTMFSDLQRFCIDGGTPFNIDTTFDIFPELWLTDTTYQNLALVDKDGKHPEFPGPMMVHFRKDRNEFRYFAMEIAAQQPNLIQGLKKIGHDLDKATANGFKDIFQCADHLWCTQHLQGRTSAKLKKMNVADRTQARIMADLYGSQQGFIEQEGLADAIDIEDFEAKV